MKEKNLVCIANINTCEVLRIQYEDSFEYLFNGKNEWFFTTKTVYRHYKEGLKPQFKMFDEDGNIISLKNVFVGKPIYKENNKHIRGNPKRLQRVPLMEEVTEGIRIFTGKYKTIRHHYRNKSASNGNISIKDNENI